MKRGINTLSIKVKQIKLMHHVYLPYTMSRTIFCPFVVQEKPLKNANRSFHRHSIIGCTTFEVCGICNIEVTGNFQIPTRLHPLSIYSFKPVGDDVT